MSKYTLEFKLKVVKYYLSGHGGQKQTADQFGIPRINVRTWLSIYEQQGRNGLKPLSQRRKYSGVFKCTVVEYMHQEVLSIRATAIHFNLLFSNVAAWDKIYSQRGKNALLNSRQGPPSIMWHKPKIPFKPDEQKTHTELLNEIEYLRTEVEYLKKLDALILERKRNTQKTKRK